MSKRIEEVKLVYLASPYTHESDDVRHERYESALIIAGSLMSYGFHVFSPIVHTHPIAEACDLPKPFEYWEAYDRRMLSHCDLLFVLQIEGWRESVGIRTEYNIARQLSKEVYTVVLGEDTLQITLVEGDLYA